MTETKHLNLGMELMHLTSLFQLKSLGIVRPITGWDMSRVELRNYKKHRK